PAADGTQAYKTTDGQTVKVKVGTESRDLTQQDIDAIKALTGPNGNPRYNDASIDAALRAAAGGKPGNLNNMLADLQPKGATAGGDGSTTSGQPRTVETATTAAD